jgi:uncharacterized protein (TIGR03086 family)
VIDLHPAASEVASVVAGVTDDQLGEPTPCPRYSVATLLHHLLGLSYAFTHSATKANLIDPSGPPAHIESRPPSPSADQLPANWREQLPIQLAGVAAAWSDPAAWEGMATAGGQTMPAEVTGVVALNELVVHGWDLARATGQSYTPDDASVQAAGDFLASLAHNPRAREGIFGPVVAVGPDASLLARTIGLSGRDPRWQPGAWNQVPLSLS